MQTSGMTARFSTRYGEASPSSSPHLEACRLRTTRIRKSRIFAACVHHLCNLLNAFFALPPHRAFFSFSLYVHLRPRPALPLPFRFPAFLPRSASASTAPDSTAAALQSERAGSSTSKQRKPSSCMTSQNAAAQKAIISARRFVFVPAAVQPANAPSAVAASAAAFTRSSPSAPLSISAEAAASSASVTARPISAPSAHFLTYHRVLTV